MLGSAQPPIAYRAGMAGRFRRVLLLLVCLALGSLVAWVGHALTGYAAWVLALPAALAVGWWAVADPTQCTPRHGAGSGPRGPSGPAGP